MVSPYEPHTPDNAEKVRQELNGRSRCRTAALRAKQLFPGALGEFLNKELMAAEEFAYRFGGESLMKAVVEDLLTREIPRESDENPGDGESRMGGDGTDSPRAA